MCLCEEIWRCAFLAFSLSFVAAILLCRIRVFYLHALNCVFVFPCHLVFFLFCSCSYSVCCYCVGHVVLYGWFERLSHSRCPAESSHPYPHPTIPSNQSPPWFAPVDCWWMAVPFALLILLLAWFSFPAVEVSHHCTSIWRSAKCRSSRVISSAHLSFSVFRFALLCFISHQFFCFKLFFIFT